MSIAIVALLAEAIMDLGIVPVLMLGVSLGVLTAARVNHTAYDEILLMKKGVPCLEAEIPHAMEDLCLTALHVVNDLPNTAYLHEFEKLEAVQEALDVSHIDIFPV